MPVEIVPIAPHSDGDATHRPKPEWKPANPNIYLEKLATQWKEKQGTIRPGISYYLDRLPDGYVLFERARPSNAKLIDRHLYGHPGHKFFDSPNRFYPHFEHLMENGTNVGCPCTICHTGGRTKLKPGITRISKPKEEVYDEPTFYDEEATPDTIRMLLNRLKRVGQVDVEIQENLSMDWRAERDLTNNIKTITKQPSWMPRVGEIVLFVRELTDVDVCIEATTQQFKLYSHQSKSWLGHPQWEVGVVGQVPEMQMQLLEDDLLLQTSGKEDSITYSGFRVEPLPDPDDKYKSITKRYKYIPLHHIRPFAFHEDFLRGLDYKSWHPTIDNARKIMSTISLLSKHHFKGKWPSAKISSRGLFLGTELICSGDTVKLLPDQPFQQSLITTVLHVESIKLEITNLDKASTDDDDEAHPYNSSVYLYGQAFTTEAPSDIAEPATRIPPILTGYTHVNWYRLHEPHQKYKIPFNRVAGRLHEANALLLWYPTPESEEIVAGIRILSTGVDSVRNGRLFSAQHNKRIIDGKDWFWGDTRAEVLDIETLNGVDVSYHDSGRNDEKIYEWENAIKVLEHKATAEERAALKIMASARARVGASMQSKPSITAQDVAQAAKEEGLDEDALLGSDMEGHNMPHSDVDMKDAQVTLLESQDELDDDDDDDDHPRDVMTAFGLGSSPSDRLKTSPIQALSSPVLSNSGWSPANGQQKDTEQPMPSPSRKRGRPRKAPIATVSQPPRPRGRPRKVTAAPQGSSLKQEVAIDLTADDSAAGSDSDMSADAALAAFKKPRLSSGLAAPKSVPDVVIDDSEEEEVEQMDHASVLAAFKPRKQTKSSSFAVVVDVDDDD